MLNQENLRGVPAAGRMQNKHPALGVLLGLWSHGAKMLKKRDTQWSLNLVC